MAVLRQKRPIPFALVAPATILLFGAAVTIATTLLGLRELTLQAEKASRFQADTLSEAFAKRLQATAPQFQDRLVEGVASKSGCMLLLIQGDGKVIHAAPGQPFSQSTLRSLSPAGGLVSFGEAEYFYESSPVTSHNSRIYAFSPVADIRERRSSLISSMAAFAALLLAGAGFVGWALARDVHADVLYVRDMIVSMAKETGPTQAEAIPVRSIDQVGQLTSAFNTLLERFQAAERAYRQDLSEARSFDEDRGAFLAALSHELRTPLNTILGFADVLLDEIDGPLSDESRENLTVVRTSGEHLRSLIDDILALGALESGEFRLSREELDLSTIAHEVVTEARVTAAQKNLTVTLNRECSPEATTAFADRRRIRQIFGNVISNAVKLTSKGGVTVCVSSDETHVITTVSDTGPGIAKEQLEAIFEEFRQVDSSNPQRLGTGLGLSISRRLVQMHGGTIRAESSLGEGSTFTIKIPIKEPTIPPLKSFAPTPSNPTIHMTPDGRSLK